MSHASVCRACAVLGMQLPALCATTAAQVQGPQRAALACTTAELLDLEAELRQTYRQLSVAVHPDKCSHPLASKVALSTVAHTCPV